MAKKVSRSNNPDGRPGKWKLGKTCTIRVPIVISQELLEIARDADKRGLSVLTQNRVLSKFTPCEVSQ